MKTMRDLGQGVLRAALIASMLLGGYPATRAQQKTTGSEGKASVVRGSKQAAGEETSSGPHEGIKVHGHWTITVRNADGSVASRNEFENSLNTNTGSSSLLQLLSRTSSPGLWSISVVQQDSSGVTQLNSVVLEAASTLSAGGGTSKNLLVSADSSGLHFSGTTRVGIPTPTGTIVGVNTNLYSCPASSAPGTPCPDTNNLNYKQITARTLSTGIPVQQNQSIDVTVTISFS